MDVIQGVRSYWSELLVVVEFVVYTTPGPHGFAPRDIDRRWSIASPLERELAPFEVLDWEPMTEYVQRLFREYQEIRNKVINHYAKSRNKGRNSRTGTERLRRSVQA